MKRQEHVREVEEVAIRIRIEPANGRKRRRGSAADLGMAGRRYLGTSPDVPGLVAEGRSIAETIEIAQSLARKIIESCREHGDPLPAVFSKSRQKTREFLVPVPMP